MSVLDEMEARYFGAPKPPAPKKGSPEYEAKDKRLHDKAARLRAERGGGDGPIEMSGDSALPGFKGFDVADAANTAKGAAEGGALSYADALSAGSASRLGRAVAPEALSKIQANSSPALNRAMSVLGYATPAGVPGIAGAAGGAVAKAAGLGARPIIGGIVGGATGGAVAGGAESAVQGNSASDIAKDSAWGAASGGVGGGLLGTLQAGARGVLDSNGGKARKLIEKLGGKVGLFSSGRGGAFDQELKGLPANDRGIGEASVKSSERILQNLEDKHASEAGRPYAEWAKEIEASGAGAKRRADMTKVHSELLNLKRSERLTSPERDLLNPIIDRLETHAVDVGDHRLYVMTETQANEFRGMLDDLADTGKPSTTPKVAKVKLKQVANEARDVVDKGPFAKPNAIYNEGSKNYDASRNLLHLTDNPRTNAPVQTAGIDQKDIDALANMQARDTQNTVTAGIRNSDRLDKFAQRHPESARDIELPRALAAKSDLEFTAGRREHGGLINRLPPGASIPLAAGEALFMNNPKLGAAAIAGEAVGRNLDPIAGRVLYKPAQATNALAGSPEARMGGYGALNPLVQSVRDEKQRNKAKAEWLKAAGMGAR